MGKAEISFQKSRLFAFQEETENRNEKCFSTAVLPDTMVIEVKHMPKVARNYQREDFSELLAQMQHPAAEPVPEKKTREPKKENRAA